MPPEWSLAAPSSFSRAPHGTVVVLTVPVLGSLIAEPLTGLVDTAFVARLGVEPLAGLGVGTMLISAVFWGFSFLGVATQTHVAMLSAKSEDGGRGAAAANLGLTAIVLAGITGTAIAVAGWFVVAGAVELMGAEGRVADLSASYLRARLVGAPAMLVSLAAFGALRGAHDMRTPLWIAVAMNALNLVLDPLLIFGLAGLPALGITGAGIATTVSQWIGAACALASTLRRLGRPTGMEWCAASLLLSAGASLVLRAVSLNGFLFLGTRRATLISAGAGAVHQVIRSTWFFNALFMDAFAVSGQSLVAYFLGKDDRPQALRVAKVVCLWSLGTGAALGLAMLGAERWVHRLYLPSALATVFAQPWRIAAAAQPISGLTFGTDGILFGCGAFGFLRNAVLVALGVGVAVMFSVEADSPIALPVVWWAFVAWVIVRAVAGLAKTWIDLGSNDAAPDLVQ